jgi:acyl-CoA synthetase (AMP-forming)/AMP-acid ligase II
VAAFSVPGPEQEHVVVVAECQPEAPDRATSLRAAIGDAVFTAVRFVPDDIVLLPPHTIPLTSSGKVMRPEARRLYLEDWRRDR